MTLPKLVYYLRPITTSATIKNTVPSEPTEGHFPGFSASGQDVWVPYFDYNGPAIVLSAVGAQCGKTFIADGKWGAVANTTGLAVDRNKADTRYFWYVTNLPDFWEKGGAAQPYVKVSETLRKRIDIPDLSTQRQIAAFLDHETARIDLLIEKKQRLVAFLREKAKSVNELFFLNTKTMDTQPLHRLYRVVTGKTPSRNEEDNFSDQEGLPWATPANLGFLAPIETTKERLTEKGCIGQPVVDAGTVLLNGIGSVGKIGIAGKRLSFNQQIHALIPKREVLSNRFLFFQLIALKEQVVLLANSTTLPILNGERLGRLQLKIFSDAEQNYHCRRMDNLLQHEDRTAEKIDASIDRLKEYRSALITAAVTGQINVAEWSKAGTNERQLDAIQAEMEH